jgi:hypothetical protein
MLNDEIQKKNEKLKLEICMFFVNALLRLDIN